MWINGSVRGSTPSKVNELMKVPVIDRCPGCGVEPAPVRDGKDTLGLWCDKCGFNASIADIMWADYQAHALLSINIRTAAKRIKERMPLLHSYAKVA